MAIESIIALVSYIFTCGLVILFGKMNYQSLYKEPYSFLNHFPYEMNDNYKMKINNYFRLVTVIMGVSSIFLQITLLTDFAIISHILPLIIGCLTSIFLMTLFFVTMKRVEAHMFIVTLATSFNILSFLAFCYFLYATPLFIKGKIVYLIIAIVLALINAITIFSPFLKRWSQLDKDEEKEEYKRPKVISLAIMEWLLYISHFLYLIMLVLATSI